MKKIIKLLLLASVAMLTLPLFSAPTKAFKHTFNTLEGWDIRNGITYHQEGDSLVLTKGKGLFFKRLPVDPGREYELKLTGSGNGEVHIGYGEIVFDDPFKDSNEYKIKFRLPEDTNPRMMLRLLPKKDGQPFKLTTIELTPIPDPEGWVRHDRNALIKSVPSPKIVRGMTCGVLDQEKAKLMKDAYAKVVMLQFKDKSELASINKQIDIALQNDLLPIVLYNNDKELEATWLAAKESLGEKVSKVYAFVLSNPKVSRDDINVLVKKLRPQFKDSWFVFNTDVKNYPNLNPIDDLKIIYASTFRKADSVKVIEKFCNMVPAPFMAFGSAKMANVFEESHVSWVIGSLPKNLKRNIAKIERPMHKGGDVQAQTASLVKAFKNNRKANQFEFAFITDTHYRSSKDVVRNNSRAPQHTLEMAKIAKELKLDLVANGGDFVSGDRPREESISDMKELVDAMKTSGLPLFVTMGNHDDGVFWVLRKFKKSDIKLIVTGEDWHNTCVKPSLDKGAIGDKNFDKANYCYMDFPESKVRFINLCVSENPMTLDKNDRFVIDSCGLYDISGRQLNWLATQALNFSDKPDAKEWGVVLMSHCTLSGGMPNGKIFMKLLQAFVEGSKYSGNAKGSYPATISCDFTAQGAIPVLMNISGHVHKDSISYSQLGYLTVRTLNDVSRDGKVQRVMNTPSESSWSIITIDREKNEANILRYGAGIDIKAPLFKKPKKAKK